MGGDKKGKDAKEKPVAAEQPAAEGAKKEEKKDKGGDAKKQEGKDKKGKK